MNYKRVIAGLSTFFVLSGSVNADGLATYLPLTTSTHDASWIFFGVNGFSDGRASSHFGVAAGFSTDFVELQDIDPQDDLATWGLSASGAAQPASDNLMSVQGIDDTTLSTLSVAAKVLVPYVESEPIHSMYICVDSLMPNVKVNYKSSMEGQTLEIYIGSDAPLYSVKLSEHNTYNHPAQAIVSVRVASSVTKLSSITDVLDYQLGNNPLDARYYSKTNHQDGATSLSQMPKNATFYHFDATAQQWKIWDTHFSGIANDFTAFQKGDAYWGRIDVDDSPINNDGTVGSGVTDALGNDIMGSGLILGKSGEAVPNADVYKDENNLSKLTSGWNMVAFDDVRPYVRRASTGLVTTSLKSAGKIVLTDSTDVNSLEITLSADDVNVSAKEINQAIEIAKLKATLPSSFNIKAFASNTVADPDRIIFISDAKFTLEDETSNDNLSDVYTLTGANPYNELGVRTTQISNLDSATAGMQKAISVYGEYSVIVDMMTSDLTGGDTAATLDSISASSGSYDSAKITIGTESIDYSPISLTTVEDSDPDGVSVKSSIESHPLFSKNIAPILSYGKAIELDSLSDGSEDKMIISSTVPFYIKDATYTRVFDYNVSVANSDRAFKVVGSQDVSFKPNTNDTVETVADMINDAADTADEATGVYAGVDGTKIIAVSTTLSTFDIKDVEDGEVEFFEDKLSYSNIAKGAIAGVYALDTIAKMPLVQHSFSFENVDIPDDEEDSIAISIAGGTATPTEAGADFIADTSDKTERLSYFDRIVAHINADILTDKIHAFAYHNYDVDSDDFAGTKITIEGMDVESISYSMHNKAFTAQESEPDAAVDANAATAMTLGEKWSAITNDLRSNAVYAPNRSVYGPLYTIREAGYDVKALLKATTDVRDRSVGWDGIDITRDESDWFKNNEFNMFSTNLNSGYWVYLEPQANNSAVIGTPTFLRTYTYYFNNKDANGEYITKNVINAGQFSVDISGFNGDVSSAYVIVNGEEVALKRDGTSDTFTAEFTKYALQSLTEGATGPLGLTIRATNGKGEAVVSEDAYKLDYTAPILNDPTSPDESKVLLSAEGNASKFYVYKEYIPELYESRVDADKEINRFVGEYLPDDNNINLCKELTFGHVDNLRVIAADGNGRMGFSNLSNAKQFRYATMLKASHVLKDEGGDSNETSIGERYNSSCVSSSSQPQSADDNNGVSLKVVHDDNLTARMVYEVIEGITLATSVPWTSAYSIGGETVINIKSLVEYRSKPFFIQYNNKIYVSAFPASEDEASNSLNSDADAIKLDDVTLFTLDGDGNANGGSGNEIDILNNTVLLP